MTALQLIKDELKSARDTFDGTVGDITEEMLQKDPGGKALPLGATYAHLIFSDDAVLHMFLMGKQPLYKTTFQDKTGTDMPMPDMDENWSENNEKWARAVHINLTQLIEYKKAVYAAVDEYINNLKEEDLEKEVDLGSWGKKTVVELIYSFLIGHMNNLSGEISALKGIQGAKGYPF